VIPRQPEPPAIPGVVQPPAPVPRRIARWTRDQCIRLRWEIAPLAVTTAYGTAVETYALTSPGWGEPTAFGVLGAALTAGTLPLVDRHQVAAYATGAGAAVSFWSCWQLAAGPSFGGVLIGGLLSVVGSIPYWRFIASRRDHHADNAIQVETAKYAAMQAYAQIPGQRQAPEIETVADEDRTPQPGDFPETPWPGVPDGKSIADPVRFSDRTNVTLLGGHVLLGGGTDFGKSGLVHLVCCDVLACRDAVLMGIDMKYGAVELGVYRHAGARIASTPDDALQLLKDVRAEGKRRGDLLGVTVHPNGELSLKRKWTPTPDGPQWVVVIDELAELVDEVPEAAELLRSHTRLLRSMGITIVAGCQITSRRVFGGDTDGRGQYGTRVCVRTFDAGQTNMIMGQGMHGAGVRPDLLQQPGEFVIISRHHDGRTPDRAYLLSNEAIAGHVRQYATGDTAMPPETEPEAFPAAPEPAFQPTGSVTGDILAYLADRAATPKEVADAIGHPNPDAVRARMSQLREARQLVKDKHGRYAATQGGKVIASNVVRFHSRRKA
jgi:hypothetical protein